MPKIVNHHAGLGIAIALFGAIAAFGATRAADNEAAPPACELHVFPVRSTYVNDITQNNMGGILPALINDAFRVKSPEEIMAFMRESVPRELELEILRSIDFAATLKGKDRRIVIHDEPYEGDALNFQDFKTSPPIVENPSACYSELVLQTFYYEKSTLSQSIKISYFFRVYTDGKMSKKAKFGAEGGGIKNFPPDDAEQAETARQALVDVYRANLLEILAKK